LCTGPLQQHQHQHQVRPQTQRFAHALAYNRHKQPITTNQLQATTPSDKMASDSKSDVKMDVHKQEGMAPCILTGCHEMR
jgi:hypothetical protein